MSETSMCHKCIKKSVCKLYDGSNIQGCIEYYPESNSNTIFRQATPNAFSGDSVVNMTVRNCINEIPPAEPKWHCMDCKWWKDSDGVFRRGVGAESKCPINRQKVFEGNGYCYMFEPQERSEK